MSFQLSFGAEFESSYLSITNFKPVPRILEKYVLAPHIQCYGDRLNRETQETVERWRSRFRPTQSQYLLRSQDRKDIAIDLNILKTDSVFNNAEFTVTFSTPITVESQHVFRFIVSQFFKAVHALDQTLTLFGDGAKIKGSFPYAYIYQHQNLYLLNESRQPDLRKIFFVPQITLGVEYTRAKPLLDILYNLKIYESGRCRVYEEADRLTRLILDHQTVAQSLLSDYIFLFCYSFLTRHSRREHIFLFRTLFSKMWRTMMSTVQRDCICRRVNKLNKEQSLAKYFIKIHYMEDSVQTLQRKRAQHISTSTVIDEEGRFFIEIRGFNNILMDILEEMDNEKYFTIDNIQRYKQGLTQRFLSTFR